MKISKYTFLFDANNDEFYAYNTLSNALIEIDKEAYAFFKNNNNSHISDSDVNKELYDLLITQGILSESDEDDYLKYKSSIVLQREQRGLMHLTLAPTMDCCFSCYYCFEKYKNKNYMTPDVMDSIIKYVTSQDNLTGIKITWFGGEPLMALPQMEEFYNKFTAVWDKPIESNIITTGYHIDEAAIKTLMRIGISSVQITIDGIKETHNKIKYLPDGQDVFSKVWENIELLCNTAPEIGVTIRVNLTQSNSNEFIQLFELFYERLSKFKKVAIAPAFVLDRGTIDCVKCDKENILFDHKKRSEFILDLAKEGIDSPFIRYPERFFNECAIRNRVAISFDPEGYAYKCWEVIGNKEYAIGKLNKDGGLTDINEIVLNRQLFGADPIEDPMCTKCKYLPICNGGCPIQRIQNKYENGKNNVCTYHKGFMVDFLKVHLAMKKTGFSNQFERSPNIKK